MPFRPYDIYTSSGSASLFNSWTTPVTKFDTSSFYNWEQDNEPIHDLEERTYLNWEHAGLHLSSVPGMVFTVSADTPAATLAASSNIFTTVSAAIEALPTEIRFPILIEVANFGNIGELNLNNVRMGYGGSLEIINRTFAKAYGASGGPAGGDVMTSEIELLHNDAALVQYKMIEAVSSIDVSTTLTETSAVHIKTPVLSAIFDTRLTSNLNSVFQPAPNNITNQAQETSRLAVAIGGSPSSAGSVFNLPVFDSVAAAVAAPHLIRTYDVSSRNSGIAGNPEIVMGKQVAHATRCQGMIYGNYLTRLKVINCDGPIYLRNFFVMSKNHNIDGVQVFNSNDVWLDNCTSVKNPCTSDNCVSTKKLLLFANTCMTIKVFI